MAKEKKATVPRETVLNRLCQAEPPLQRETIELFDQYHNITGPCLQTMRSFSQPVRGALHQQWHAERPVLAWRPLRLYRK